MSGNKSRLKPIVLGLAGLIIVGGIGYGAYRGRTQDASPAQTRPDAGVVKDDKGTSEVKDDSKNDDKNLIPVRTWTRKDCGLAPWLVTDKLGYFKEQGLKLVFTGELQPNQQIPSLINGDNDIGGGHPNSLLVADNGGANLIGVVRGGIDPGPDIDAKFLHMWWYVNPKKYPDVKSIADLKNVKGKLKFSTITANICTDFLTNKLFEKYGIPIDKIEWVNMPDIQAI